MTVYLLHFAEKISHAQHYIGFTDNLKLRIHQHHNGRSGAVIVKEFFDRGIDFVVARTWEDAGRDFERYLKKTHKRTVSLCPICQGKEVT
jgi:predicted GIY-YIG superfamily endonuclease